MLFPFFVFRQINKNNTRLLKTTKSIKISSKMADVSCGEDMILLDQIPFYTRQPTEKLEKIFAHYLPLLKNTLGDHLVSLHPIGSSSIPGMPGSPVIDIILRMKNFPPTEAQLALLTSINFKFRSKAPHDENDLFFMNFGTRFDSPDEPIKMMDYGQVMLHFVSRDNDWPKGPVAFVEYLKTNKEAFRRYRDSKLKAAELQRGKHSSENPLEAFKAYKTIKNQTARELIEEAKRWAYDEGNFQLPF